MKTKFLLYAIFLTLSTSWASWSSLLERATGGSGSGSSWRSGSSSGYSGGFGGGHK
jgi:hypothetical protein